ncbi:adhesion G-protein coupled receptor D2 [Triplophysa dalaica]|uniref:adhesion G-protein coupled receptor D2 n=1 Tax=Triplophysa dalaica TaxID=1582913 RepID=UPI0024DF5BE2|nr:adhesion G-protein coupled receptor D2 [Triplophysa dalaica]
MDAWSPEDHHMANSKYTYVKMSKLLFGVILANAMIVGMCENSKKGECGYLDTPDSNLLLHRHSVYQLVNAPLGFENAQKKCNGQFGELTMLKDDKEGAQELLTKHNLTGPVWFRGVNTKKQKHSQVKKKTVLPGLSFKFKDGFARVNASFPALSAVSICARVQWDPRHENISTVFSYASPVFTNEFQLRGQVEESRPNKPAKKVRLALLIKGEHPAYKAELPLDENWHHVCVTWRRNDTFWAIYVDGKESDSGTGAANPQDIHGQGIFIVGQDQDSFGGTFTEPFVGNLTDLNIWDGALELKEVKELETCSQLTNHRAIFRWEDWNLTVHPSVKNVSATLDCLEPPQNEECVLFFSDGHHEDRYPPCTDIHPFICKFRKECYVKMKEVKQSMKSNPSSFMQHLMNLGMSPDDLFSDTVDGQNWTSVLRLLNISEQAVSKEPKGLEGRDIISLMHVLSRAANLPSTANKSWRDAERLGQSFINLADSLLNQDNATWNSIKEVVKGPMAVIQNVDRMVTNLNSLLMNDTDIVQINSTNIKLQIQQTILSEVSGISAFCGSDVGNGDCISIKDMKELHNNGYRKVTLLNTWYNSVKCFSDIQQNTTLPPTATDGSLKMVLGSSIISSTVLRDGEHVSIAVQFTLQHITEETSKDIICAFWDFNLTQGGGWSKKGCFKILSQNNSTTCYCNHTTNFALLLQIEDVEEERHNISIQIFSFIASGVSLCGLTFTFILFVALGVPKSDRTTVHKNLIVALAVSQLLLIFSDWAAEDQVACWLVTVLLHLFFLSSFCWMLVEGLLLWSKVVSVNISEERRMKLYYALGWGLPVVIVVVTLAVTLDHYKAEEYCWLNVKSAVIWAFAGPVLFVVSVNAVVLFRVVMVTVASARRKAKMLTPSSDSKLHTLDLTWAATRPVLILLPVLGLTWLVGVLVHLSVVLAYIFIILNGFQGLYIFLVYAVYNSEVRNAIKRIQEKRKALSFTNCSQPTSFMPSQKSPSESWVHSQQTHSSPDNSESSTPMSRSLVFKNERFKEDNTVSLKAANGNQVVQLTAFKPSG